MSASASPVVPKKRSRKSEIALLEQISTSLDAVIGDRPLKKSRTSASDANKSAAKNFLATKMLAKNIAKACAQEEGAGKSDALLGLLVEEYKEGFPTLTKQMLLDGIAKVQGGDDATEGEEDDELPELKFGRIVAVVDAEMAAYHEKVEALKRAREVAAKAPEPSKPSKKKRKSKGSAASPKDPNAPKRGPGRPKGSTTTEKNTPENFLINEIVKRYAVEKSKRHRLPNGALEAIVEETKRAHQMEHFDFDMKQLDKKVRFRYNKLVERNEVDVTENKYKVLVEEVYARYSRTKTSTGGKLPPGTLDSIISQVKLEYGLTDQDINMASFKVRVQSRFAKENPEFQSNPPGQVKIAELSEEAAQRRQLLLNEITARYVREKEAHPKKLADGTLDRIIEQTKNDLDIQEFDVPKASIRGRINRKSHHVQRLGSDSPAVSIDEPLVATINSWLSQGKSVTRAQGLELANGLLKGQKLENSSGQTIKLDATWWRSFLDRNRKKLVCSGN